MLQEHPAVEIVVEALHQVRDRDGLEAVLELATLMVIIGSTIIARERGQAHAVRLLDDATTVLPPRRQNI